MESDIIYELQYYLFVLSFKGKLAGRPFVSDAFVAISIKIRCLSCAAGTLVQAVTPVPLDMITIAIHYKLN